MDHNRNYSLFWAIFVGIPFGIGMISSYFGYLGSFPKSVLEMPVRKGYVQYQGDTLVPFPSSDDPYNSSQVFGIVLNDTLYISEIEKQSVIYRSFFADTINLGKEIELWARESIGHNWIGQLSQDGKTVVAYKRPYGRSLFFLIPGILSLFFSLAYLYERITGRELFRRRKKRLKNSNTSSGL